MSTVGSNGSEPDEAARRRAELDNLDKQSRLLDLQLAHFEAERRLNDRQVHAQIRSLRINTVADRFKAALQFGGLLAGLVALLFVTTLAAGAINDHGLVVDPFRGSPDLAQRGLDGTALADRLLDHLAELQAQTRSARAESSYRNKWGDDLKVEIPSTGVSIGDLTRALRERFGHETKITGDVYHAPEGLVVAVRAGAAPAKRFVGKDADLEALLQQAAEAVYAQTQPYRFTAYLADHKREAEALVLLQNLARDGTEEDRPWAYVGWAAILQGQGRYAEAAAKARAATRLAPDLVMGWDAIGNNESPQGHDEAAFQAVRREHRLLTASRGARGVDPKASAILRVISGGDLAEALGDYRGAATLYARAALLADPFGLASGAPDAEAEALARAHDPAAAPALVQSRAGSPESGVRALAREAAGDWSGAADLWGKADAAAIKPETGGRPDPTLRAEHAYAEARRGDLAGAEALIGATPLDCNLCLRTRGRIAALRRDWAGAERWFAMAQRDAPSLPFAETDWAEMLLARGDAAGAIAKLRAAHAKGPRFADPLALWAQALLRQGDRRAARAKLDAAEKLAPGWDRLRLLRAEVL